MKFNGKSYEGKYYRQAICGTFNHEKPQLIKRAWKYAGEIKIETEEGVSVYRPDLGDEISKNR